MLGLRKEVLKRIRILSNSCEDPLTLRAIIAFIAELFPNIDTEIIWQACL